MLAPSDSKNRKILLGLVGQSFPDMTEGQMEWWIQHPEGLPAIVAGLKNAPTLPEGEATAPLHVGSPPSSSAIGVAGRSTATMAVLALTTEEGRAARLSEVPPAGVVTENWREAAHTYQQQWMQGVGKLPELPMLEPEDSGGTAAEIKSIYANRERKGAELPPECEFGHPSSRATDGNLLQQRWDQGEENLATTSPLNSVAEAARLRPR